MTVPAPRAACARVVVLGLAGLLAFGGRAAHGAEPVEPAQGDGPPYAISHFDVRYAGDDTPEADLPLLRELLEAPFSLARGEGGWVAPDPSDGRPGEPLPLPTSPSAQPQTFYASAVGEIAHQIVRRFRERGVLGVYVGPHEADIDIETEDDLRRQGDTVLRLRVEVPRVRDLRSIGVGDRLSPEWRIDNPVHRRIRENSPIQPDETARPDTTTLVDERALDEYLQRLNRHPGRHVEAALAPAEDGGVSLDYRITESRPWYVYAQTTDSGTDQTNPWQTRMGAIHQQLTNHDDILAVEYLNAGFDDVNAVNVSYQAPWFSSRRPRWLSDDDDNRWLDWLPRDDIPWIGVDDLRWGVFGSWNESKSNGVDYTDDIEAREWDLGVDLEYTLWQRRSFFLDTFFRFTGRSVSIDNDTTEADVSDIYLMLPELGLRSERYDQVSSFRLETSVEGTANRLKGDVALLGRLQPDRRWVLFKWDFQASHFLEPLLNPKAWADPSTPGSSTLAHEIHLSSNGQWAFDRRLIPQASQVIGGLFSVRGYDNSLATGDSVAVGTVEYRFHLARSLPVRPRPYRVPFLGDFRAVPQQAYGQADWDLVFRAFADFGHTWRYDVPSNSPEDDDTLIGAGVGLELQLGGHLRARADYARALKNAGPKGDRTKVGDDRFHFLFSILY
ncbi:MAG: hypothetical protein ACQGVK_21945 [Myxococcota bacterium]